jgi:hypothetical protein
MWISLLILSLTRTPLPLRSVASLSLAMERSSVLPLAETLVRGVFALLSPFVEAAREEVAVVVDFFAAWKAKGKLQHCLSG